MSTHMPERESYQDECIDPELGESLWHLDDPHCPPDLRDRLAAHVAHCAGCRLRRAVAREVAAGLADGTLSAAAKAARSPWVRRVGGLGAAALAAGLALVLLTAPADRRAGLVLRGDDGPAIVRPVADAVVTTGRPVLAWTPVTGAARYTVSVEAVDGSFRWTTETEADHVAIPADAALPGGTRFRVLVEPIPPYVAPAGGLRSSFRTGSVGAWFAQRLQRGSTPGRGLMAVGLAALLFSLAWSGRNRRQTA